MSKHTPEPWSIIDDPWEPGRACIREMSTGFILAKGLHPDNAKFLVAAPDLLTALIRLEELWRYSKPHWAPGFKNGEEALTQAQAAIAKAEGK